MIKIKFNFECKTEFSGERCLHTIEKYMKNLIDLKKEGDENGQ